MENHLIIRPCTDTHPCRVEPVECPSIDISQHILVNSQMAPELYKCLESILERTEFEVEIPRRCMQSRLIQEKLYKAHPSQRVQRLKQLMDEYGLVKIVLVNPVDSTAVSTGIG